MLPGSSVAQFSTESFARRDRFTVWREVFGRGLLKAEIQQWDDGPFRASATLRAFGGLRMMSATTTGLIYRRPSSLVQSDDLVFSFGAAKGSHAQQRGREAAAEDGDALLMLSAEWSLVSRATEGSFDAIRLPRSIIMPVVQNVEDLYCRRIPGNIPSLRLLTRYLSILSDDDAPAEPELQHATANHIVDLIALTLGATRDAAHMAETRGVRAARLASIKSDIMCNLTDESLSVGAVAVRHSVTPRQVQRLFEEAGSTFREYVLEQRLARAYRLLGDVRLAGRTLTAIAFDAGFGDLSYFNRAFRRRFGATPSDIRARAKRAN
jgi:AraC-like DNA-binding protein